MLWVTLHVTAVKRKLLATSVSDPDPHSMGSEGGKSAPKKEKLSLKIRKKCKN
jgi:hypothetical protein